MSNSHVQQSNPERLELRKLKASVWNFLSLFGYDKRDWARIALFEECDKFIKNTFDLNSSEVLAVSSGGHFGDLGFKNCKVTTFPEFDICVDQLDQKFDLIVADQIFEHVKFPHRAGKNVYDMLKPGGWFLVATPFFIKIHPQPLDCCRWTPDGVKYLLMECGFSEDRILTNSWGNRFYIIEQLCVPWWPRRGFLGSLKNEKEYPVVVWAFAQK
jgi:SAM-dependent methyltransferase